MYHISKLSDVASTKEDPFGFIWWEKLESHDNGRKIRINLKQAVKLSGQLIVLLSNGKNAFFFPTSLWLIAFIISDLIYCSGIFFP